MQRATAGPLWLLLGFALLLLAWPVSNWLLAEPAADGPSSEFSASAALVRLERLAGAELPHPIGSAENARVREQLVDEFDRLGYGVELQETLVCREVWATCGFVENVIARLPGTAGQPAVLMTAHYDSVGAGPGVADDLAGVAALLEVARIERDAERLNPLLFVISDGEEVGLLGAEAFTRHPAFQDVAAVVNVEARGTSGQSLLFETSENNAWLISAFAGEAPLPVTNSLYYELYRLLPNDTDFSVYREAGLPGLNFAAIEDARYYHTPLDNLANLSPGMLQHHGDNLLAAARALADTDLSSPPAGDAVFMNLLPGLFFQLPVGWAFYLSLAGLVLWFVAAARLISTGQLTGLGLFLGVGSGLAALLLAGTLGQLVSFALPELSAQPAPWWSAPLPVLLSMLALAVAAVLVAGLISSSRSGLWGLALGAWFWFGLCGFLLLEFLPGASVVFLLPATAFAALFGLLALSPARGSTVASGLVSCLVLFVTAVIWLQLALAIAEALGLEAGALVGVCAGLAALGLLPLTAVKPGLKTLPAALTLTAVLGALLAATVALRSEVFTPETPQLIDVLHFELAEDGASLGARWLLDGVPDSPMPEALRAELDLSGWLEPALPWTGWGFHVAEAEPLPLPFPAASRLPAEHGGLRLRLESGRDADQLHLFVPRSVGLQQLIVADGTHVIDYSGRSADFSQFSCYSPRCDGLEVELLLQTAEPFELLLADQTPGVPQKGAQLMRLRDGAPAVPWQDGDVTLRASRLTIDPEANP